MAPHVPDPVLFIRACVLPLLDDITENDWPGLLTSFREELEAALTPYRLPDDLHEPRREVRDQGWDILHRLFKIIYHIRPPTLRTQFAEVMSECERPFRREWEKWRWDGKGAFYWEWWRRDERWHRVRWEHPIERERRKREWEELKRRMGWQ